MGVRPVGVLLAGGLGRRMGGGDKPLRLLGGRPLLDHVIERIGPQCRALVLNANGDPARFAAWGLPVAADTIVGNPGPLAGVLSGMRWAAKHVPDAADIVSVPTDTPFLPADLVERLVGGRGDETLACAATRGRVHPVAGLWPVALANDLETWLRAGGRQVRGWTAVHGVAIVHFDELTNSFLNVNTAADLGIAEEILSNGPRRPCPQ